MTSGKPIGGTRSCLGPGDLENNQHVFHWENVGQVAQLERPRSVHVVRPERACAESGDRVGVGGGGGDVKGDGVTLWL